MTKMPHLHLASPRSRPSRRTWLGALASTPWAWAASAQTPARFPDRPITLVVPFAPGGIADLTARAVADAMGRTLGLAVVVDNRPGAGSIAATQAVLSARPDGHTLLLLSNGHAVSVGLFKRLPYDPLRDLAPISTLGMFDLGVFAPVGGRHATLAAALAWARTHPGQLNIATINAGSTQHLAAKMLETQAGIDATVVPYKGTPAVVAALRSGEVDLAVEIVGPLLPQVGAGAVRALAVSSTQRHPALPDVPTVQQAGVAGYDVSSWNALAAPAGTPAEVLAQLNQAVRDALQSPAVRDRLQPSGMRLAASSPVEARALLEREIRRWGDVIRAARIEPE
ncbi:MAG: tripartite tricarboxylate transporter substrate-binding protein [Aquabacterium sp.]